MKNITIIGGGTAGWITALFLNKIFPKVKLTLIESKTIGTVNAGEGSTPNINWLLKFLNIDSFDFEKNTNATKKVGVEFKNWRGDNTLYNHDFKTQNGNFKHAYHFDNFLIGEYFKNISIKRGVDYKTGDVVDFSGIQNIEKIKLKSGEIIETEFVFDCSGFSRLVIGNYYKTKWNSAKEYLKVNSAIPFLLDIDSNIKNNEFLRTGATTLNSGWMWSIPLKNRYGCGYVFDDSYIDESSAKNEIEKYLNKKISFGKKINFESGYFEDSWVNNCIAIGLSSSFFEPLEATSIMLTILQLQMLISYGLNLENRKKYNDNFRNLNRQILSFIRFHYICDRNDTPFWKDYTLTNLNDEVLKIKNILNNDILKENSLINIFNLEKDEPTIFANWQYLLIHDGNMKKKDII